jgi:nucleoside-diphosphate-sugar epimerase
MGTGGTRILVTSGAGFIGSAVCRYSGTRLGERQRRLA